MNPPDTEKIVAAVNVLRRFGGSVNEVALVNAIDMAFPRASVPGSEDGRQLRQLRRRLFARQPDYLQAIDAYLLQAPDLEKARFVELPDGNGPYSSLCDVISSFEDIEDAPVAVPLPAAIPGGRPAAQPYKPPRRRNGEITRAIEDALRRHKGRTLPQNYAAAIRRELEPRFGQVATSLICRTMRRTRSRQRRRQPTP